MSLTKNNIALAFLHEDPGVSSPIRPHLHLLCKDEILQGNSVAQDFRPRFVTVALDLAQVLCPEQDPVTIRHKPRERFAMGTTDFKQVSVIFA